MHTEYHKEYSRHLGRDMEFKVYGHGGKPVLVFPCQNGRFFDWEGFGMLDTLQDYLGCRADSALHRRHHRCPDRLIPGGRSLSAHPPARSMVPLSDRGAASPHPRDQRHRAMRCSPPVFPWEPIMRPTSFSAVRICSTASSPFPASMTPRICTADIWMRWFMPTTPAPVSPAAGGSPLYQHVQCAQDHSLRGPGCLGGAAAGGNPPPGRRAQAKRHSGMGGLLGIRCQP